MEVPVMGKFFSAVTALCFLLSLILGGWYLGLIRIPIFEKTLTELETECVVAAIHSDARWAGDVDEAVRREVARTVLRHSQVHSRDICDVFRLGLTLVPEGYQRTQRIPYLGEVSVPYFRSEEYVRRFEATEASWKSDILLVKELLKERGNSGCATRLIRKVRKSNWIAQSGKARDAIRNDTHLHSIGRAKNKKGEKVGVAEFFCPIN